MSNIPAPALNTMVAPGSVVDHKTAKDVRLFKPSTVRSVTLKNRIVVSPMCMYSSEDGFLNDFHLGHYLSLAVRGVGMIIIEATAVTSEGRISPHDSGLWKDEQIAPLKRVVDAIKAQGAVAAIQLCHAGRKASMGSPFAGYRLIPEVEGGWPNAILAPSAIPLNDKHGLPHEMTKQQIKATVQHFQDAAVRADKAGIEMIEFHSAHGYLMHSFVSGNSNKRTDEYGGSLENRMRFPLEVVRAVRAVWPEHKPLWLRLSATDFKEPDHFARDPDGWDVHQAIVYAKEVKKLGVDVIDCSSGGNLSGIRYPVGSQYQVPFADAIKREADIPTGAVGLITEAREAEKVIQDGKADYILLAREFLRDPNWTLRAASELGVYAKWANQYERADVERWNTNDPRVAEDVLGSKLTSANTT